MTNILTKEQVKKEIKATGWALRILGGLDVVIGAIVICSYSQSTNPVLTIILGVITIIFGVIFFNYGNKLYAPIEINDAYQYLDKLQVLVILSLFTGAGGLVFIISIWYVFSTISAIKKLENGPKS